LSEKVNSVLIKCYAHSNTYLYLECQLRVSLIRYKCFDCGDWCGLYDQQLANYEQLLCIRILLLLVKMSTAAAAYWLVSGYYSDTL